MIDKRKIKTWSLIGARATVGMYALDLVKRPKFVNFVK